MFPAKTSGTVGLFLFIKTWFWSLSSVLVWIINPAVSDDSNCTGDFNPLQYAMVSVFDPGLFYVFPFYTSVDEECLNRTECCFYETELGPAEANCNVTAYPQYMANIGHPTQPCTHYSVLVTAYSKDNSTTSRTLNFTSGAVTVTSMNVNRSASGRSATVSWTFPERNVRCVKSQFVSISRRLDNVRVGSTYASNVTHEVSFNGLEPCVPYYVNIQLLVNVHSAPGASSKHFHTPSNVTSLASLKAMGIQQDLVLVTYSMPQVSGRCIDHVHICWVASEGGNKTCTRNSLGASPWHYITGLAPDTIYNISATPVAPHGREYTTVTITGHTLQCEVSAVTDIDIAVEGGGQSAKVSWSSPEQNQRCADHQYVYCSRVDNHEAVLNGTLSSTNTSIVLNQLEPCINYSVAIQPINWNPTLPPATNTFFKTPSNVTRLSSLNVTGVSTDKLLVSYSIPQVSRDCVHHFFICWSRSGNTTCTNRKGHYDSSIEVTGLESSTNYTVSVTPVAPGGNTYHNSSAVGSTWAAKPDPLAGAEVLDLGRGLFLVLLNYDNQTSQRIHETSVCVSEARVSVPQEDCGYTSTSEYVVNMSTHAQPCTHYLVLLTAFYTDNTTASTTLNLNSGAGQVTDVRVQQSADVSGTVNVSWACPERNVHCVIYQTVTVSKVAGDIVSSQFVSREDSQTSFKDLQLCVNYSVQVQPMTQNLALPRPTTASFNLPSNVRSLSSLEVTGISQHILHVAYNISDVSSYCVGYFEVCWQAHGGNKTCANYTGHTSSSRNITGLSAGTNYTVQVTPVSPGGQRYNTTTAAASTIPGDTSNSVGRTAVNSLLSFLFIITLLMTK